MRALGKGVLACVVIAAGLAVFTGPTAAPAGGAASPDLRVRIDSGIVRGVMDGNEKEWRGVPYAAPPVGNRRWRAPRRVSPWSGVRQATEFAEPCAQPGFDQPVFGQEDCLYLNVFAPAGATASSRLPVMVQIHPGGNIFFQPYREAERLVERGVIVVTVPYRLGIFGFGGHPELTAEGGAPSGDYALLDQIAGLRWVQRNIAAFGGNPHNVTLMGSSAGAVDVAAVAVSPLAQGLLDRAIVQTMYIEALESLPIWIAELDGIDTAAEVGCAGRPSEVACLRSRSTRRILAGWGELGIGGYTAWVGGRVNPDTLLELLASDPDPVPLLIGTDREEASNQWFYEHVTGLEPMTEQFWLDRTDEIAGPELGPEVRRRYPREDYDALIWALVDVYTDGVYACPGREYGLTSRGNVYRYVYGHTLENDPEGAVFRAGHIFEDLLLWGDAGYEPSPAEEVFADRLADYWTNFARRGDPNGVGLPLWPRFDDGEERAVVLDHSITQVNRYHRMDCEWWEDQVLFPADQVPEAGARPAADQLTMS